jgi:hypothetical protein
MEFGHATAFVGGVATELATRPQYSSRRRSSACRPTPLNPAFPIHY